MPRATEVSLPRHHKPRFPDKCVVCSYPSPVSSVRLMTGTIGWWTWILLGFGKPFVVKAPACAFCGWRLHLTRVASLLITLAILFVAAWLFWPMLEAHVPRDVRKWAFLGIALLCLAPQIVFEVFYPQPFDITAWEKTVDYEFRDAELAVEFALLNADAERVEIG